ncbi:MAG: hypothetical protein IAF38_03355, partial [Bacteroidia bacterium]|nr:hypothetical protein [Bacteroidia bacterium]
MKKTLLSLSLALIAQSVIFAQVKRKCSTHDKYMELVAKDQNLLQRRELMEKQMQEWIAGQNSQKTVQVNTVVTVPVVVHVLYQNTTQNISTAQIQTQIVVLNEDFGRTNADTINTPTAFTALAANTDIQFCLATTDPSGNPTTGIERQSVSVSQIGNGNNYYSTAAGGLDA